MTRLLVFMGMSNMTYYDVEKIREDFPVLHQEHSAGKPLVYLDNGASSQHPVSVIEAMNDYYRRYHANVHRGIHKLSEEATNAYEQSRGKVQRFINAATEKEIIYTRGTTESINLVVQTWGRKNLGVGDVVISTEMEHHANIVSWQILAAEKGFTIKYIPVLPDGTLDLDLFETWLKTEPVKIVAVTHTSNVLGTLNPIADMARKAHEVGALILVDGAQGVPHAQIDVQALDVDFFAFSGHKMCAPTGIGVLYGKYAVLETMPPFMGGGDMIERVTLEGSTWNEVPYKFEAGTPSIAEAIGLGVAVDYLESIGMDAIHAHEQGLVKDAYSKIKQIDGITVYGSEERAGIIAFSVDGMHAHDVAQFLDADGIAVRSGHHCTQPLHDKFGVSATARASFYLYNTRDEVDYWIQSLQKVTHILKR
jgi:cysteine desulfurase/selenocysteine lyase